MLSSLYSVLIYCRDAIAGNSRGGATPSVAAILAASATSECEIATNGYFWHAVNG